MDIKEDFLSSLEEMGLDHFEMIDFIDDKGLCELSHDVLLEHLDNPKYLNPLIVKEEIGKP